MRIVWDEPKRLANIAKHQGLEFATLSETFFENALILPGKRNRWRGIGPNQDGVICVVFARYGQEGNERHHYASRQRSGEKTLWRKP